MKFLQLHPGARFRYEGRTYRKISPLKAADEADQTQRIVPRSARVVVLDDNGEALHSTLPDTLPAATVEHALQALADAGRRAAGSVEPPLTEGQRVQLEQSIERAKLAILARLAGAR